MTRWAAMLLVTCATGFTAHRLPKRGGASRGVAARVLSPYMGLVAASGGRVCVFCLLVGALYGG